MITRQASALAPGARWARTLKSLLVSRGDVLAASEHAAQYRDSPEVAAALQQKALMPAMTTTDSALNDFGIATDFISQVAKVCGFEQSKVFAHEVSFATGVRRSPDAGSTGAWIGPEGAGIPPVTFAYDLVRLLPRLIGFLAVITIEALRSPRAEAMLRDTSVAVAAKTTDTLFLNPSSAATEFNPASITNGAPHVNATLATLREDLSTLLSFITTSGVGLTWIARPADLAIVAAALGGASDLPRTLLALPVIRAPYAPKGQITLVDLNALVFADGAVDIGIAESATIEMEDPTSQASAGAGSPPGPQATTLVSMFQSDSACLKVTRTTSWSVLDGAVAYLVLPTGSPA